MVEKILRGFGMCALYAAGITMILGGLLFLQRGCAVVRGAEISAVQLPPAPEIEHSQLRKNLYEAARVYGRAGCGDYDLAELTARWAYRRSLPAGIIAAKVAVESHCNPLAVSSKGAVGLTQVRLSAWKDTYDFTDPRNSLTNPETSLRIGTEILANLIERHGIRQGLRHYNGARGQGEETAAYADKILGLAK